MSEWNDLYSAMKTAIDKYSIIDITNVVEYNAGFTPNQTTLAVGKLKNEGYNFFFIEKPSFAEKTYYACTPSFTPGFQVVKDHEPIKVFTGISNPKAF